MYEWFDAYCMAKPGVTRDFKAEWGWYRYFVGGKFFAAAGRNEEGEIFFLTLRCEPDFNQFLRQNFQAIAPGFYSNKELWNTVWFSLEKIPERDRLASAPPLFPPDELVREMTDRSYHIMVGKLTKKVRAQLFLDEK
ncbi:MAG TPA: MmcQ/YjbR family DNA-binding protein [Candidatus Gallacutalibacter pullistercoris]|nr:MmcQ/YjbR family DNA-binding protein [Candidatus Gallacutalibacter pullistercoris]